MRDTAHRAYETSVLSNGLQFTLSELYLGSRWNQRGTVALLATGETVLATGETDVNRRVQTSISCRRSSLFLRLEVLKVLKVLNPCTHYSRTARAVPGQSGAAPLPWARGAELATGPVCWRQEPCRMISLLLH